MDVTMEQVAAKLLEVALKHAAGRKIRKMKTLVGDLVVVFPDDLALAFQEMAKASVAENVDFEIEIVSAIFTCLECGAQYEWPVFSCEICGRSVIQASGGNQVVLQRLEFENNLVISTPIVIFDT